MKNELPRNNANLLALGLRAVAGLHEHEAGIGIKQNTESAVAGEVSAFAGAVDDFGKARREKRDGFIAQAKGFDNGGISSARRWTF